MKIYTIGGGFIASHLPYQQILNRFYPNRQSVFDILNQYSDADVFINTLGRCGAKNIDSCESDKQSVIDANTYLPMLFAQYCEEKNKKLINISSGCVNYGLSPRGENYGWREIDQPSPLSFYSKSKFAADQILLGYSNCLMFRIRMPISDKHSPRNLFNKLLSYSQILEEPNSVTFVEDLVRGIDWGITNNISGIYNFTNPQPLTHTRILEVYNQYSKTKHIFTKLTPSELDQITLAPRSNCILDCKKLNDDGFFLSDSEYMLQKTIINYLGKQ